MLRPSIVRSFRTSNLAPVSTRSFSIATARMAEGDTGGMRRGGMASGDAFTRREGAEEAHFIKQKEMEKLQKLKAKLKEQRKHLDELEGHIDELQKEQGGEHN